jgi:hypothetical protein
MVALMVLYAPILMGLNITHFKYNVSTNEGFSKFIQEIADRRNFELVGNGLPEFTTQEPNLNCAL